MKTPKELAEEWAKQEVPQYHHIDSLPMDCYAYAKAERGFLAGYKAAQQWISVKDRLPKIASDRFVSDEVLWISTYGEMHVSCLEKLRSELRVDWGEAGLLKLDQVTHWMPLPELPKEEK